MLMGRIMMGCRQYRVASIARRIVLIAVHLRPAGASPVNGPSPKTVSPAASLKPALAAAAGESGAGLAECLLHAKW